jgi:HSP20 family protein
MELIKRAQSNNGIRSLHDQIDDMFNDFFRGSGVGSLTSSLPSLDIYNEDDKNMIVELQAPGFEEKDIDLRLQDGILEIKAQRQNKAEEGDKKRGYIVRESSTSFYRRIVLPEYVDEGKVGAELDKGILKITIPYTERPEPKRIKIASKAGKSINA